MTLTVTEKCIAILTDADKEDILRWATKHRSWDVDKEVVKRTRHVGFELSYFMERSRYRYCDHARWLGMVLNALSDEQFQMRWSTRKKGREYGPDDVWDALEEAIAEAQQELIDWHADEPDRYFETYDKAPDEMEHPWRDEMVAFLKKVKDVLTPYRVWLIKEAVEDAAGEAMRDHSFEMAGGEEYGFKIERASTKAFEEALKELQEQLA